MDGVKKVYRYKVTGDLYELEQVLPDGNFLLRPMRMPPPGDLVGSLIAAPVELELIKSPA